MSSDQAHASVAPPDHRDVSGEEAWNRRCSIPILAPWTPQHVKTEDDVPEDTSSKRLPFSVDEAEEGEISETKPHNHQHRSSEAHSFLYSIPQWQPPSTQSTGQHPSERPMPPVPSQRIRPPSISGQQSSQRPIQPIPPQRTRPPSARLGGLPSPSMAPVRQSKPSSTHLQGLDLQSLLVNLGRNERIPGIYRNDVLDGRIGIRPRCKKSTELQQLKSSRHSCGEKGIGLSRSMKIIIQQFMVANGYVCPHQHMPPYERPKFRNSLLVRLDLHNTFITTNETRDEQRLIKSAWASVDGYISEQSREWRAQSVFEQISETARPTFAVFTKGWTDPDWDGSTRDFTRATILTTVSPVLSGSLDDPNRGSKPTDSEAGQEAISQVIVIDDNTKGPLDNSNAGLEPTLKRSGHDGPNNQANKRTRIRDNAPITSKHEYTDHVYDEKNGLEFTRPEEKGLPIVIEAIHHARATMLDLAPMSAKDLAFMQQDRTSHGFPSMLAETLTMGRAYTATIGQYFDNALELLSLLKETDRWKVGSMEVLVDCACEKGGAAPEQLQNRRVHDPSIPSNWEVEVQCSHEREDPMPDRSQDGQVSDRPMPSTWGIEFDRVSRPKGATPDPLENGTASGQPVAMTERTQIDRLCQPTAAKLDQVQNKEVPNPEAPSGTTENPCVS